MGGGELKNQDELLYLKSLCLICEVYDYFGKYDDAREILKEGFVISENLQKLPNLKKATSKELRIAREKVRLCLDYSQAFFYREGKYEEAERIIKSCHDFVVRELQNGEQFPCWGTLAQLQYAWGCVHRQKQEFPEAEESFAKSIWNHYQRAERKKEQFKDDPERLRQDLDFACFRTSICLALGLGWLNYERGYLLKALRNNILPALASTVYFDDEIMTPYIHMIYASILRARAGRKTTKKNENRLKEALASAEKAYAAFEKHQHPYLPRAAYELSIVLFCLEDFDKANTKILDAENAFHETDFEWRCKCVIVRSRIERERGNYQDAINLATEAFDAADAPHKDYRSGKIDSLIARSEARISAHTLEPKALISEEARKDLKEARKDLKEALRLNKSNEEGEPTNPKFEAACNLHLARTYIKERKVRRAREYLERWGVLKKEVENELLHQIGSEIETELLLLAEDFFISGDADKKELKYKPHLIALQKFLLVQAESQASKGQDIADSLDISRQTIHDWGEQWKKAGKKS